MLPVLGTALAGTVLYCRAFTDNIDHLTNQTNPIALQLGRRCWMPKDPTRSPDDYLERQLATQLAARSDTPQRDTDTGLVLTYR